MIRLDVELSEKEMLQTISSDIVPGIGAYNVPDVFAGDVNPYPLAPEPQDDDDGESYIYGC